MAYDRDNVFAKIIRGELESETVLESEHALAFRDIEPQAPVHVLIVPKGPYDSLEAFAREASDEEIVDWVRTIGRVAENLGVTDSGYRVLANSGRDAHQEVAHLHAHLFAGVDLGRMIRVEEGGSGRAG